MLNAISEKEISENEKQVSIYFITFKLSYNFDSCSLRLM